MSSPQHSGRLETRNSSPQPHDERKQHHQLEQDLDAARQMSRVRQSSFSHHPGSVSPPRASPIVSRCAEPDPFFEDRMPVAGSPLNVRQRNDSLSGAAASPLALSSSIVPISASQQRTSPAVARFYQHHGRRGSNASVNSESHFIDHRHQQHSLGANANYNMGRSYRGPASMRPLGTLIGRPERVGDESTAMDDGDTSSRAVADGDRFHAGPTPASPSQMLDMGSGQGAGAAAGRNDGASPRTLSRRASMVEDDVCFPLPARSPHAEHHPHPSELYGGYADDYMDDHDAPHHAAESGVELPPGYPYTFDLQALEDFAGEERARAEASTSQGKIGAGGLRHRAGGAARNSRQLSIASAAAYGISPESDDATFYSRRPRKYTPDEAAAARGIVGGLSAGTSKYQRKLALFESHAGSADPPSIPGVPRTGDRSTTGGEWAIGNIMGSGALLEEERRKVSRSDVKTPLLKDTDHAPAYDGTYGELKDEAAGKLRGHSSGIFSPSGGGGPSGTGRDMSEKDKPYRFTFYSNALSSTIHARHLFELPAPDQTFEDLLRGRPPRDASEEAEEGNDRTKEYQSQSQSQSHSRPPSQAGMNAAHSASRIAPLVSNAGAGAQGRVEGVTAPPTRTGTPLVGDGNGGFGRAQSPFPGGLSAAKIAMQNSALTTATSGQPSGSCTGNGHSDTTATNQGNGNGNGKGAHNGKVAPELAKTLPGGQIMMDNDPEANTWWLDVLCPTDQEMKLLARVFGIHPLTTEDILMEETREKIELFRNYYLVCFRSFDQDPYSPTYLEPLNMYIIVFREGTLSFHFKATPHPQNVRRRIKQLKDYINVTSDWISYALIDDITDAFGPLIQNIEYEVDSIDELVLILREAEQSDMLRRIGTCRKKVMGLLRLMGNKADVVKGLAKRCNENWSVAPKSDIGLYLSDIQDHLITMTQNLNHYEKILSRSHSNYLAQISIEMTDANNEINDVLSKLTALGTVIVPLNVITGLWGMNVNVPGQDVTNLYWFGGIVSVMVVIAVSGYFAAIRYLKR